MLTDLIGTKIREIGSSVNPEWFLIRAVLPNGNFILESEKDHSLHVENVVNYGKPRFIVYPG